MSVQICKPKFIESKKHTYFTREEYQILSRSRIIQKNLVHFQGFPDSIYDKDLLLSPEYFGQYGNIIKIVLVSKEDKVLKKKTNSAYLTFETKEQAAYCILSVDSIKIDNQLVRAFFGTTKYCNHFLNNFKCFNSEKCMFLHNLVDKSDIIAENSKFGYSEHIKLAKKIIGFGSLQSQLYVMNNSNKNNSVLPNIVTIYHKDDILIKTQNHRRKKSNESEDNSLSNSNSNNTSSSSIISQRNSINEFENIEKKENLVNNEINILYEANLNLLYKSRNKSRFEFANNNINLYNRNDDNVLKVTQNLIDDLSSRIAYFIQFNKNIPLSKLEYEFCNDIYQKSKNDELKKIIQNLF
jgi:hypothetical protein